MSRVSAFVALSRGAALALCLPATVAAQTYTEDFVDRTVLPSQGWTLVNNALRDGLPEERRRIGSALADSGLLYEAIDDLMAENHESCYGAFSLLFLVAKAGVVEPLSAVIEKHPSLELSLAVIRLLASSHQPEVVPALLRLSANASLAPQLRSAASEAVTQIKA